MWTANKWHLTEVTAWNESDHIIAETGLVTRTQGTSVTLRILIMRLGTMFFYDGHGGFNEDGIQFQISKKRLRDNGFTMTSGKTHIEYEGSTYRVISIKDYTIYKHTKLMECKAVKIIDSD